MPKTKGFSKKESLFIDAYLVDLNGADAYRKAGYSQRSVANVEAAKLIAKPYIAEEITKRLKARHDKLGIDADALLKRAETILTADHRQLSEHHVGSCRYCYGLDHDYQWKTQREWMAAVEAAEAKKKKRPNCEGGFGYDLTKRPHPRCPECNGLGIPYVRFADTRDLSPEAQVLFEGVKQTKDGIEFRTADKQKAFDLLAKHKGILKETVEVTGKDGKPIEHRVKAKVVLVPVKQPAETSVKPIPKYGDAE